MKDFDIAADYVGQLAVIDSLIIPIVNNITDNAERLLVLRLISSRQETMQNLLRQIRSLEIKMEDLHNRQNPETMKDIFNEIENERERQEDKWGQQNHPILDPDLLDRSPIRMCEEYEIPSENRAKQLCMITHDRGKGTYMHILVEEVSEAASCGRDIEALRKELIQTAAVTVAMIESLDRNQR